VIKHVYKKNKGSLDDKSRIGTIYWNRGLIGGMVTVEAESASRRRNTARANRSPASRCAGRWSISNSTTRA